jgi:hemerythrin-like metal-binding protein
MPMIEWTNDLILGIDAFDEQHLKFIGFVNELDKLVHDDAPQDQIFDRFLQLDNYTRYHFKTETEYLEMIDYPDTAGHIMAHNAFLRQLDDIQMTLEAGIALLSEKEMVFLRDWIIDHIRGMDRKYVDFVAEDAA